jgi:hypothetical protein
VFKLGFGGGGGSTTGVNVHWHGIGTNDGGSLKGQNDTTTGTSISFNSATAVPLEVML